MNLKLLRVFGFSLQCKCRVSDLHLLIKQFSPGTSES